MDLPIFIGKISPIFVAKVLDLNGRVFLISINVIKWIKFYALKPIGWERIGKERYGGNSREDYSDCGFDYS